MTFDIKGLCIGACLDLFDGTGLEDLRDDFNARHIEFLEQSDFDVLTRG